MNKTQIANLALSWLGQNHITSIDDSQVEATVMKDNFDAARDLVLEDGAWTFATVRERWTPTNIDPAFGSDNVFLIPNNVLRVHRCYKASNNSSQRFTKAVWRREGAHILSPESVLWVFLINKVTNTDLFSPGFVHALAARLAADTALALTENEKLANRMEALYERKRSLGLSRDGLQGLNEKIDSSMLTGARSR